MSVIARTSSKTEKSHKTDERKQEVKPEVKSEAKQEVKSDVEPCCVALGEANPFYAETVAKSADILIARIKDGLIPPPTEAPDAITRSAYYVAALTQQGELTTAAFNTIIAQSKNCKSPCCAAAVSSLTGTNNTYVSLVTTAALSPFVPLDTEASPEFNLPLVLAGLLGPIPGVPGTEEAPPGTIAAQIANALKLLDCVEPSNCKQCKPCYKC